MRRLGQKVAQSDRQREDMYIFGEEAGDLDSQLGACAKNEVIFGSQGYLIKISKLISVI